MVPNELLVVKLIADVVVPLHTTGDTGRFTCADGLIVIINVLVAPVQGTPELV